MIKKLHAKILIKKQTKKNGTSAEVMWNSVVLHPLSRIKLINWTNMDRGLKLTNTQDWNATEDPILCW